MAHCWLAGLQQHTVNTNQLPLPATAIVRQVRDGVCCCRHWLAHPFQHGLHERRLRQRARAGRDSAGGAWRLHARAHECSAIFWLAGLAFTVGCSAFHVAGLHASVVATASEAVRTCQCLVLSLPHGLHERCCDNAQVQGTSRWTCAAAAHVPVLLA